MKLANHLKLAFILVAVVEAGYALAGLLIPPSMVATVLGWNLTADGQWVTKLLGLALGTQAAIAWVLRRDPPISVAVIFTVYQIAAATIDWLMWTLLADDGIFANSLARLSVMTAIPLHYALGVFLLVGVIRARGRELTHA